MVLRRMSGEWDKAGWRGRAVALALTAAAGLAACSSTPKYVNPVELYRDAAGFSLNDDTTGERNAQNLEAGRNQPYPNLGTVPPPPDRAMSGIDRQKLQQGLTDDRAQAKQTDADLRASAAAATGAPRSITRPSSSNDGAAPAETKRNADAALLSGRSDGNGARRRSRPGSEPAPQETALSSPTAHAMPEGDTPRPAPPPPSLPPPEKARKPATDQAAKSPLGPIVAKRPSPAQATAAADPQRSPASSADAGPRRSPSPAGTATAGAASTGAPTATIPSAVPANQATRIPPPPPADMMMPAPDKLAAAEPPRSAPPPAAAAPRADAPKAAAAPTAKTDTTMPAAAWPPPLGPSDTQNSPPERTAALDPARPPQPPQAAAPAPTAKAPEQQQAALAPPPQAMPRAQDAQPAAVTPPPRTGRLGSVSMQAAEIRFASSGLTLTPDDDRRLADVVKLYDKHGGIVRVVGYGRRGYGADAAQQELASFSKAIERANVVAKALTQLGLASNRIVVQAAPIGDGLGEDRAEVLLEF
jgi:outer membrane protein OmpA-like peptidoglycan-associated protein